MDDAVRKLLDEHKAIILPDDINHDAYMMVLEAALMYPDDEIDLYCRGDGGFIRDAFAIIDVIREHGNFTGLLAGMAYSSHADIWVACNKRYCHPFSAIGIHKVKLSSGEYKGADYYSMKIQEGNSLDLMISGILAEASNNDNSFWLKIMGDAGDAIHWLYADEIINVHEMALPIVVRHTACDGVTPVQKLEYSTYNPPPLKSNEGK